MTEQQTGKLPDYPGLAVARTDLPQLHGAAEQCALGLGLTSSAPSTAPV
jgi:hypothetical protein